MRLRVTTTTISTPDAQALAAFYERLLGWSRGADEPGWSRGADEPGWVTLRAPDGGHALGFHHDEAYGPPTWPSRPGEPSTQMHLEIATNDLDAAAAHAIECGATLADHQPQPNVRVMLDPDGHPFCLWLWPELAD